LLNTQHKFDKGTENYGLSLENQHDLSTKMKNDITNMRVQRKNYLLPFQKGKNIIFKCMQFFKFTLLCF